MTFRRLHVVALVACSSVLAPAAPASQGGAAERRVYVTVVDRDEKPVKDLTPDDFGIREDGQIGEIVSVTPAADPPVIFLMADNSGATRAIINDVRLGLAAFVTAIQSVSPDATIALMAHGGPPTMLQGFTKDGARLQASIRRLVPTSGESFLLESLVEAARQLRNRPTARRLIVCFGMDAAPEGAPPLPETIGRAVRDASAAVWSIALAGGPGDPNRDYVLNRVIPWSGGLRQTVVNSQALEAKFARLAGQLVAQYVISYRRPAGLTPQRLEVGVRGEGRRVLATQWPPR